MLFWSNWPNHFFWALPTAPAYTPARICWQSLSEDCWGLGSPFQSEGKDKGVLLPRLLCSLSEEPTATSFTKPTLTVWKAGLCRD
jgi:hypothetical protein